jgi:hypothetical protein
MKNTPQELPQGADHQPTLRLRQAVRDEDGALVLDEYGNKTYAPLDISAFTALYVYLTCPARSLLVAKYNRLGTDGHLPIDISQQDLGILKIDIQRADTLGPIQVGDVLHAEIGYSSPAAAFAGGQFVRLQAQTLGKITSTHKALQNVTA